MLKSYFCPNGASSLEEDKVINNVVKCNKMEKVQCDLAASRTGTKQLWEWKKEESVRVPVKCSK